MQVHPIISAAALLPALMCPQNMTEEVTDNGFSVIQPPSKCRLLFFPPLPSCRRIRDATANSTRQTLHLEASCLKSLCASVVLQGNVTFSCTQPQLVACTFLSSASSFLSLPSAPAPATGGFSVRFQFRTWNPEGLLLSTRLHPPPQRLELRISDSRLCLTLHNSGRQKSEVSAGEFSARLLLDSAVAGKSCLAALTKAPGIRNAVGLLFKHADCVAGRRFCRCLHLQLQWSSVTLVILAPK